MKQKHVTAVLSSIEHLLDFIYNDTSKKYIVNTSFFDNNINIFILEQNYSTKILDINIQCTLEEYHHITSKLIDLIVNNDDTFGCLESQGLFPGRNINNERVASRNIIMYIPIYDKIHLNKMQAYNEQLLKKFENVKIYQK